MVDCVRHLPAICSVCFTFDNQGIVAGCHDGALVLLHLPLELTRDAAYVLLGGPSSSFLQTLEAAQAAAGNAAPRDPPPVSGTLILPQLPFPRSPSMSTVSSGLQDFGERSSIGR